MNLTPEQIGEAKLLVEKLQIVLGTDNEARKAAEEQLSTIREGEPEKYAVYLTAIIVDPAAPEQIRALSAVILRRTISATLADKKICLWEALSLQSRAIIQSSLLTVMKDVKTKDLVHKLSNLLVEIAGTIYEEGEQVWQELLNLVFLFVNSEDTLQVDASLQIFNGLFSYIIDYLIKFKDDLLGIFKKTLCHSNIDIKLAALQAVSNFLQTVEQKDTKPFQVLLPEMCQVIQAALDADDETVLQDALIEFNEIAEIEPKFFQAKFTDVFNGLSNITLRQDFANPQIRQQPVEFFVTVIERIPSIAKKNTVTLKKLFELIFRLMVDIDQEIDQEWLRPKEGFRDGEAGEDGEDNVDFGKGCIDKIISAVGDEMALPILSGIVNETLANDADWRYKNAGLMAFSQVGEYIEDIQNIAAMVPIVLAHLKHANPRIRFAALHCIGQISDDMTEDFQATYGATVLPALIDTLDDPVPRVSAHCCSAITNFMDGAEETLVLPYLPDLSRKLAHHMTNGISIQKENSVTAFATTVVVLKEKFDQHFDETLNLLLNCLETNPQPEYKQFRAQIIEAITLISSAVSEEVFLKQASRVVSSMIYIQKSRMDETDPQRSYLLSAWQRICLIMKQSFTPYLQEILPSILSAATLNPEMGVSGKGAAELKDVLEEIRPEGDKKKANIMTDEIEEKDSAIQMLIVFIEELGAGFAPYIDQVSKIFLGLTQYYASDNIRTSAAEALASLIKCAKEAQPGHIAGIQELAKGYCNNIIEAMDGETETEVLKNQAAAIKDIMDEAGENLLQPESVDQFSGKILEFISQSENRIQDNNKYQEENAQGEEDEQLDEEDLAVLKEENKAENELQIALAEILGILFKTHKMSCRNLVQKLIIEVLPAVAKDDTKHKNKFLLFILDDMVEYLGPDFLGPIYPQIAEQICKFSSSKQSAIRQASVYGIGMIAQHGGQAFQNLSQMCLQAIQSAIQFPLDSATKEKKNKLSQYHHARDNAVAALGKVLKFQPTCVDTNLLITHWLSLLPLTHDVEEAQIQNEFLTELILKNPALVLGVNNERLEQFVTILGEICNKKQSDDITFSRLSVIIANLFQDPVLGPQVRTICDSKLNEENKAQIQDCYSKCNEEVRQQVKNSIV